MSEGGYLSPRVRQMMSEKLDRHRHADGYRRYYGLGATRIDEEDLVEMLDELLLHAQAMDVRADV